MVGLYTLEETNPSRVFPALESFAEQAGGKLQVYSRLPLRQLLRYISANAADCWWVSEHDSEGAVEPNTAAIDSNLKHHPPSTNDVVVIEALDWFESKEEGQAVLQWLQTLDKRARTVGYSVVFPIEPLTVPSQFWSRLRSLAPSLPLKHRKETGEHHPNNPIESKEIYDDHSPDMRSPVDHQITHLVGLPALGFNKTVLARRMLQWKRMGFDIVALEPAQSMKDTQVAHNLYTEVEQQITKAIDLLRVLASNDHLFTVTEREMFHFKLMHLSEVEMVESQIQDLISTR